MLFATDTVTEVTTTAGFLPPYFLAMLAALGIVFAVVMVLFLVGYKVIDWITPGDLSKELLGQNAAQKPNLALAVVAGAMILGTSVVLGLTVLGVLVH